MKKIIVIILILAATGAYAQFNNCQPGICAGSGAAPTPPPTGASQPLPLGIP